MAEHGGNGTRYAAGCRCGLCVEAHRVRVGRRRAERYAERELHDGNLVAVQPGLPHGNRQTYKNWGCRCEPCRAAHWAHLEEGRARRLVGREMRDGVLVATRPGLQHGTTATYDGWGCRCAPCRTARSNMIRERRSRS